MKAPPITSLKKQIPRVKALTFILFGALLLPAGSAVLKIEGDVKQIAPPTFLGNGTLEDSNYAKFFMEGESVTVESEFALSASVSGYVSTEGDLSHKLVSVGETVSVYFLHFDPVAGSVDPNRVSGRITFSEPILGIAINSDLANTNDVSGINTVFNGGGYLEFGATIPPEDVYDAFEIINGADGKGIVEFDFGATVPYDQIRIFTRANPPRLPAQKIFLAFDEPSDFNINVYSIFGKKFFIDTTSGEMPAAEVDATYKNNVTQYVEGIFSRSNVTNIEFVNEKSSDAIVVYFCDAPEKDLFGYSLGAPDRFNKTRGGRVAIFVNEALPLANLDAETAVHEIGHLLGLRHVDPDVSDPNDNSVMDIDFSIEPEFINAVSDVCDPNSFFVTHNPRYHILRYLEGWTDSQLENAGIYPGTWEHGSRFFTSFKFDGSNLRLYDVNVIVSSESNDDHYTIDHIDTATLGEISNKVYEISDGMHFTLVAKSTEQGDFDVVSAVGDPYVADNLGIPTDTSVSTFTLYQEDEMGSATALTSGVAVVDSTSPYCTLEHASKDVMILNFRGILEQSSDLEHWHPVDAGILSPHLIHIGASAKSMYFRSSQE